MSLSVTLANAVSGLTAASRGAELVSSNTANATTDGYGVRRLHLSAQSSGQMGAGVRIVGVDRAVDIRVLADRRLADAQSGFDGTRLDFQRRVEDLIGLPGDAGSLSTRLADFNAALIAAANRPDVEARLASVLGAADQLAGKIGAISDGIQSLRQEADQAIARDVAALNGTLKRIEDLGAEIAVRISSGQNPSSELDQRQVLIDRVSEIVPVKEVDRGRGQIALISPGGAVLLDGIAATFGFAPVGVITPDMTRQAGSLSGITLNGQPINLDNPINGIMGGRLAGHFAARDALAVTEQARLDAVARDLVERFQDPSIDPSLMTGDAGLFTDSGAAFTALSPAYEEGLSSRLSINANADPAQGGALRRLRDGLNAVASGPVGDATLLQAMADALLAPRAFGTSGLSGAARTASGLAAEYLSLAGAQRQGFETESSFSNAKAASLKELELRGGVDTDNEMQHLLLVETAYNANARVIQAVDAMLSRLMEI